MFRYIFFIQGIYLSRRDNVNYLKNLGISFLYTLVILLICTFLTTVLNYFNIMGGKTLSIFKIIILVLSLFSGGFVIGKKSNNKGWLEGLKYGLFILVISFIFNYLAFDKSFELKNILYYTIILISCIFGSIIGINIRKEKK